MYTCTVPHYGLTDLKIYSSTQYERRIRTLFYVPDIIAIAIAVVWASVPTEQLASLVIVTRLPSAYSLVNLGVYLE